MRETWALRIAALTALAVVLLAALFVRVQRGERSGSPGPSPPPAADAALVEAGRRVYDREDCAACHSIAGAGNPRSPLDRAGARHDQEALRRWILGDGEAASALPRRVAHAKEEYRQLPAEDLDALVAYLRSAAGG